MVSLCCFNLWRTLTPAAADLAAPKISISLIALSLAAYASLFEPAVFMLPQLSQFPAALSVTSGFPHTSCREVRGHAAPNAILKPAPTPICVLPVCAHRCCCCCCRACSVRCCIISAAGGSLFAASLTASRYSLASLMLTIRQSARQHQPLCAALSPFPFPRPFPSLHRGLNTSTIGPNTSTLLSAKRRVALHYSPQQTSRSTASTMLACVGCCSWTCP